MGGGKGQEGEGKVDSRVLRRCVLCTGHGNGLGMMPGMNVSMGTTSRMVVSISISPGDDSEDDAERGGGFRG